jgi:methyltransferase of FxLD system
LHGQTEQATNGSTAEPSGPSSLTDSPETVRLRNALVAQLEREGTIRDTRIAAALRRVPRHAFVPELPAARAYRDEVVPVKYENQEPVSTLSQPSAIVTMLEQLELASGLRVLEVGAGTGYNAALLAELVEADELVSAIDLDDDLTARARRALDATGHAGLRIVTGDGFYGLPQRAPFDRIELSVATRIISPHWVEQLVEGGLLVVPLHLKGLRFLTPAWRKHGDTLRSESIRACTFVLLRGTGAAERATFRLPVRPELRFVWESDDEFPAGLLTRILKREGRARGELPVSWAAATYLLLTHEDAFYAETADRRLRGIALFDRASESLAVLISATDGWGASSAITYGDETAYERLSAALQDWVNQGRPGLRELRLRAVPAGTDVELQPGEHRIPKPYFDLIASYHTRV